MRATQDSTCAKTVFPLYWNSEWYYVLSLVKFSLKWQPNWWQLKRTPSCSRFVIQIIVVLPLLSSISCTVSVHSCNQERPVIGCNRSVYGGEKKSWIISPVTCDSLAFCDQIWWRHQMETFSALLALCAGNSPVPVNSPHKGQWRGALMFSLICVWINGWVNSREAGDLRRHRGHYDVNVMTEMEPRESWILRELCTKYIWTRNMFWWTVIRIIVSSRERQGVSNCMLLDCLFKSLFRLTTK